MSSFGKNKLQELAIKPWALLVSSPFTRRMLNFGCLHLNQYHHESLSNPFWNGVGWVWSTSATFHLSCYNVKKSPHSSIFKTHAIKTSPFVNTPSGPILLLLVFPYRWSKSEVTNMPHNLLAPHKKIMLLSTTSMVVSNDSLDHLHLGCVLGTLFVLVDLCIVFDII
jgi:hypothetical protein